VTFKNGTAHTLRTMISCCVSIDAEATYSLKVRDEVTSLTDFRSGNRPQLGSNSPSFRSHEDATYRVQWIHLNILEASAGQIPWEWQSISNEYLKK
jgi:hypothetical protein